MRVIAVFAIAIAAILLSSAALAAPAADPNVEQARQILDDKLLDYTRARFRSVRLMQQDNPHMGPYFCGEVNAVNASGGPSGWVPFMIQLNARLVILGTNSVKFTVVNQLCSDGAPVSLRDYSAVLAPK